MGEIWLTEISFMLLFMLIYYKKKYCLFTEKVLLK